MDWQQLWDIAATPDNIPIVASTPDLMLWRLGDPVKSSRRVSASSCSRIEPLGLLGCLMAGPWCLVI